MGSSDVPKCGFFVVHRSFCQTLAEFGSSRFLGEPTDFELRDSTPLILDIKYFHTEFLSAYQQRTRGCREVDKLEEATRHHHQCTGQSVPEMFPET